MVSALLLHKILQLFIFMALGFVLVKAKVVASADGKVLSKLSLFLLMPSVIINSFDVTVTGDIAKGLMLAYVAAVVIHLFLLAVDFVCRRAFRANAVERASIIYSNAGNLIIPIVSFVLGEEYVIYSSAFLSVQLFFLWTHGIRLFSDDAKFSFKKIFGNINIIAIILGIILLLSPYRLPGIVKETVSSLGGMIGPIGMIVAGMLAAEMNFKKFIKNKRMYFTVFMRMAVCPLLVLAIMAVLKHVSFAGAEKILLISFLAAMTPSAATVMQFAQIKNNNEDYATAINIVSTLVCIITMPVFVELYSRI